MLILSILCGNFSKLHGDLSNRFFCSSRLWGKFSDCGFGLYICFGSWWWLFFRTWICFKRQNFFMCKLDTVQFNICNLDDFTLWNIECAAQIFSVASLLSRSGKRGRFETQTCDIWPKVSWYAVWLPISWLICVLIHYWKIFHPTDQAYDFFPIQTPQSFSVVRFMRSVPLFDSERHWEPETICTSGQRFLMFLITSSINW